MAIVTRRNVEPRFHRQHRERFSNLLVDDDRAEPVPSFFVSNQLSFGRHRGPAHRGEHCFLGPVSFGDQAGTFRVGSA